MFSYHSFPIIIIIIIIIFLLLSAFISAAKTDEFAIVFKWQQKYYSKSNSSQYSGRY